jgi:hypothetical protein
MSETALGSSSAVEKHIDQMETIVTSFIVPALVALFAGAHLFQSGDFEIYGIRIERQETYGVVLAIFDVMVLLFCTVCWKASDLLEACDEAEAPRAIAAVLTHKWVLNPFSYTARGALSALCSDVGASFLVFTWWIGLCALVLVAGTTPSHDLLERFLYALYWALGLVCAFTVVRLARRIYLSANSLQQRRAMVSLPALSANNLAKVLFSAIACGLGFWLFYAFKHLA